MLPITAPLRWHVPHFASDGGALILPIAQQLDDKVVETFENVMGLSAGPLARPSVSSGQKKKKRKLGLREGTKIVAAAFATSVLKFRPQGVPRLAIPSSLERSASDLTMGLACLRDILPPGRILRICGFPITSAAAAQACSTQKYCSLPCSVCSAGVRRASRAMPGNALALLARVYVASPIRTARLGSMLAQ